MRQQRKLGFVMTTTQMKKKYHFLCLGIALPQLLKAVYELRNAD